jgi:hypothetical protein
MNKKIIISIIIIFILIFIAGGLFLWWKIEESKESKRQLIKKTTFVSGENYTIRDTPEGKIIENKKEEFSVKVPEGWEVKIHEEGVDLLSLEVEFNEYGRISWENTKEKGGCGISLGILKTEKVDPEIETDAEEISRLIIITQEKPIEMKEEGYEVIEVDNRLALKESTEMKGEYVLVQIPINNKIYFFDNFLFSEQCVQEFDRFLETVSIK